MSSVTSVKRKKKITESPVRLVKKKITKKVPSLVKCEECQHCLDLQAKSAPIPETNPCGHKGCSRWCYDHLGTSAMQCVKCGANFQLFLDGTTKPFVKKDSDDSD